MPKTRNVLHSNQSKSSVSGASNTAHGNAVDPSATTINRNTAIPLPQSPLPIRDRVTPKRPKKQPLQDITARYVADAPEVAEGLGLAESEDDGGKALAVAEHRYATATPTSSATSGVRSITPTPAGPKRFFAKDKGKGKEVDLFQGRPSLLGSLRRERSNLSISARVGGVGTPTVADTIRNAHSARLTSALTATVRTMSRTSSFVATPKHPRHTTTGEGSEGDTPHRDRVLVPASSDDRRDQASPLPPSSPPREDDYQDTQSLPVPTSFLPLPLDHEYETAEGAEYEEGEATQPLDDPDGESDIGALPATNSGFAGGHLPPTPPSESDPWGFLALERKLKAERDVNPPEPPAEASPGGQSDIDYDDYPDDEAGPSTLIGAVNADTSRPAPLALKHKVVLPLGRKFVPPRTPHKPRKRKREPGRMEGSSRFPNENELWSGGHRTPETPSPLKRSAKRRESKLHESALKAILASAAISSTAMPEVVGGDVDARSSPEQMRKVQARQEAKARLLSAAADGEVEVHLPDDEDEEEIDVEGQVDDGDKENQADAFSVQTAGFSNDDVGFAEAEDEEPIEEAAEEERPDPSSPPPAKRARRTKPEAPPQSSPVKTRALRSRTSKAAQAPTKAKENTDTPQPKRKLAVYIELPLRHSKPTAVTSKAQPKGAGAQRGRKRKVEETDDDEGDESGENDEDEDEDEEYEEQSKKRPGRKRARTSTIAATENKSSRPVRTTRSSTGGGATATKSTTTARTRSTATKNTRSKANALKPKSTDPKKSKGKGKANPKGKAASSKTGKDKPKSTLTAFAMELGSDDREKWETERQARIEYFKKLEGYNVAKENVYVI